MYLDAKIYWLFNNTITINSRQFLFSLVFSFISTGIITYNNKITKPHRLRHSAILSINGLCCKWNTISWLACETKWQFITGGYAALHLSTGQFYVQFRQCAYIYFWVYFRMKSNREHKNAKSKTNTQSFRVKSSLFVFV